MLVSCDYLREKNQSSEIYNVSFDNYETAIDIRLSDLIDSSNFVKLETTPESLLGKDPKIILTKNCIIAIDENGVYKFDNEGNFIKKVIKFGSGPDEISSTFNCLYSEEKNQLIIQDNIRNKDIFQVFDIENDCFLEPIKKCFPGEWGAFLIYNDSLIMGSKVPVIVDSNRYALFIQNSRGKVVSGIINPRKVLGGMRNQETVQRLLFYQSKKDIFAFYIFDDTLFRYSPKGLIPYLIVSYDSPRNYVRTMFQKIGESRVIFPMSYNSSYSILNENIYTGDDKGSTIVKFNYFSNYYFLNLTDKSFSKIKSYTDDISGKIQECKGGMLNFPVTLPDNKIYVLYGPDELIDGKPRDYSSFSSGVNDQLQKILKGLNIMDNPILLIASIKTNIKID